MFSTNDTNLHEFVFIAIREFAALFDFILRMLGCNACLINHI